jgi:2-polyprenyl-6-methoxyphenol hydroxylase-like FAD-dependent oxidoreductase
MNHPGEAVPRPPRRVLIVGGGTAGWMCAALMNHAWSPQGVEIALLESDAIGIIGVGEGSTPKMRRFFQRLGIEEHEWMPVCNGTYKCGIRFLRWSTRPGYESYYHPFFTASDDLSIRAFYQNLVLRQHGVAADANPDSFFLSNWVAKKRRAPLPSAKFPWQSDYAYHFDARLIGEFLRDWSTARGVRHIVDTVTAVNLDESGAIASVDATRSGRVEADLFVDCTGFAGVLSGKALGVPFEHYTSFLFNDRAVAMPTALEDPRSLPSETVSTALDAGWAWKIPLTNRYGNGYVYSSQFIDESTAERELRRHIGCLDERVEARHLKMRVGRLSHSWEKNCVAIGLAQGFIEPLEATALMIVQETVEQFIAALERDAWGSRHRDEFNAKIALVYDSIRDYIYMHYKLNTRSDTPYWIAARENEVISDSAAEILDVWENGGDLLNEINRQHARMAYSPTSWMCILAGMGRFPRKLRRATHKHQVQDAEQARKSCLERLRHFPDHRAVVDGMRAKREAATPA